jgi:ABC-2 type transport system ATP-binding protein
MAAIETSGLTKEYGDETALSDLDLTVAEGEVFGFLGPNGAGKTTTIDLLLDFIRPTEGTASVLGYDVQADPDAVRDRVGVLPDGFDLWERSSGYRHLDFALESVGGDEEPDHLLDRVGLDPEDAERPVGDYSKGMAQRLAMAMALAGDPDLLILDEPSSGLDPHGIRRMQNLVREAAADGTTVFFSSHILGQVAAVCDRVGILDDGELVTVDTLDGLRETAGVTSKLVVDLDGRPDAEVAALDGVTDADFADGQLQVAYADPTAKAAVVHRLVESGATVLDFETEEATLDDLFSAFTGTDSAEAGSDSGSGPSSDSESSDSSESGSPRGQDADPAEVGR